MAYDFCIVTAVKRDGTEYEVLGLLRSLEMIDISMPIYIAVFNHPPAFDLIPELEVCGDLNCNFDTDDGDLEAAVLGNLDKIVKKPYHKILYIDHHLRVYLLPEVTEGVTIAQPSDGISREITPELAAYMRKTLTPDLLKKTGL